MWPFKLPDWIPTKNEEIAYHNEKKSMLERDLPQAMVESGEATRDMLDKEEALYKTLSKEQLYLWYELKSASQKAAFQSSHLRYMEEEIRQTPNRITEILCS